MLQICWQDDLIGGATSVSVGLEVVCGADPDAESETSDQPNEAAGTLKLKLL